MKEDNLYTRKRFILQCTQLGSFLLGGGLVASACRSEEPEEQQGMRELKEQPADGDPSGIRAASVDSCDDLSGLSQNETDKREVYGYVEKTPYPDNRCDNCSLFIPPAGEAVCGGCVLFEGPVFDEGYCDYWAPET